MCGGGARAALADAASYAKSRRQFGQPIANFGAIKHKPARCSRGPYALESLSYRTAGLIDAALAQAPHTGTAVAAAFEEFAIEASIAKVAGSETLDFVLDENVQIHGGNGFVHDYMAERFLPRCAREPDLRGHERDQPDADSGHADPAGPERRAAAHRRSQAAAGRGAVSLVAERRIRRQRWTRR
jgi:alkylation response protein AidB-like acyl-CoA dehydrogenase